MSASSLHPLKFHFLIAEKQSARERGDDLTPKYGQSPISEADCIVAVGGDGTILKALSASDFRIPVFGMKVPGSIGALANPYSTENLTERVLSARRSSVRPLQAEVTTVTGARFTGMGINEIVISRQTLQAARLKIRTNVQDDWLTLIGDGLIIATAMGSAAYNLPAGGPSLPLDSGLLALTGICARRTSSWTNTIIPEQNAVVEVESAEALLRPIRLETTSSEIQNIASVRVKPHSQRLTLLVDAKT